MTTRVELPHADPMIPAPYPIARVVRELHDVFTLQFDLRERGGFAFEPGQFNMLYLFGIGEVAISISGDPHRRERLSHTIRSVGTVTQALAKLRRNDVIGLRGPFGSPWPIDAARGRDLVIVAGGLGLAPLRPVVYHVIRHRHSFRNVVLLLGARTPSDLLFAKEVETWAKRDDLDVYITADRAPPTWPHLAGVVTGPIPHARFEPAQTTAFLCGPEVMMRFAARDLEARGVPAHQIHLSMERNMKCAVGLCGHCQFGPMFVCKDGPVLPLARVRSLLQRREI